MRNEKRQVQANNGIPEPGMPLGNAVCCFLGALIWGTAFVAQSVGGEEINAMTFVGLRFLMGAVVLSPLLILRRRGRARRILQGDRTIEVPDRKRTWKGGIVCGIALLLASWLQQAAIPHVTVGKAGFLTALYIILVPILSFLVTRRSSAKIWIGAGVAAVGLFFLCMKPGESFSIGKWEWMLFLCALAFSVQIMCVDHFAPGTDGVELSFVQFLTTGILGTMLALLQGNLTLSGASSGALLSLAYAGVFSSGIAYTLQILGQKGADPSIASLIMSMESVISAVSGFFLLHQMLSARELAGCVLMTGAIVIVQLPAGKWKGKMTMLSVFLGMMILPEVLSGCSLAPGADTQTGETTTSEVKLLESGAYQAAADALNSKIQDGEKTEENQRLLGIAYMGLGDYESAAAALESALNASGIVPTQTEYDINEYLGVCYYKLGNYEEALEIYDAIVTMRPKDAEAIFLRGAVKLQLGDAEGMQKDFTKAVSLDQKNYDRLLSIYTVLKDHGCETEGKEYLQEALDTDSDMSGYDRGRLSYYCGDYETARVNLEQLHNNSDENVVLMLGRTYEALGDYNYATNVYKTFLASNSSYPEVYNQMGMCCVKMEDFDSALEAFQAGKKLGESEYLQSLSFNEIIAYEHKGDFETAKTLIAAYRASYPGDEKAAREEIFLKTR